jgi:hypothetical protein
MPPLSSADLAAAAEVRSLVKSVQPSIERSGDAERMDTQDSELVERVDRQVAQGA